MKTNISLNNWLQQIAEIHPQEIVLGLERVQEVIKRLQWEKPSCPIVIVAGTNGKGSCVATLEKIYSVQGYRVGTFTSPILLRHNEMVRIQGEEVQDHFFCEAYEKITKARQSLLLTAFEYHTLAALDIFHCHPLDLWVLEVGLGGRLDAVNALDADVAVVTSIDLDHMDYLGDTRELIGREKAGIFRAGQPVVCGDGEPPASLVQQAKDLASPFYRQGKDFSYSRAENSWTWRGQKTTYPQLPLSKLACQNVSTALMVVELLQAKLPTSEQAIAHAIETVSLPGRIEIISQPIRHIFDVAHNPAAVAFLREGLQKMATANTTRAVFSMLGDKDIAGSLGAIKNEIDEWYTAPLAIKRGASKETLQAAFQAENIIKVNFFPSIEEGYYAALKQSKEGDCIVVFGSFHTVEKVKRATGGHVFIHNSMALS